MSRRPKCLERIDHARVLVQLDPRDGYGKAWLTLYSRTWYEGKDGRSSHDNVELEIEYQRNTLSGSNGFGESQSSYICEESMPDARLDWGDRPMSACYAPHLDRVDYEHVSHLQWIADVLQAVQRFEGKLRERSTCDCARMADALSACGVPVEWRYLYQRDVVERHDLAQHSVPHGLGAEIVRVECARRVLREAERKKSEAA